MQFSPASRYFLFLGSKHSSKHPVLKYPQSMFFLQYWRRSFMPMENKGEVTVFLYFNLGIFKEQMRKQNILN
jgi:hypothetical protein